MQPTWETFRHEVCAHVCACDSARRLQTTLVKTAARSAAFLAWLVATHKETQPPMNKSSSPPLLDFPKASQDKPSRGCSEHSVRSDGSRVAPCKRRSVGRFKLSQSIRHKSNRRGQAAKRPSCFASTDRRWQMCWTDKPAAKHENVESSLNAEEIKEKKKNKNLKVVSGKIVEANYLVLGNQHRLHYQRTLNLRHVVNS